MNQEKIGQFIAKCRKEKNMTQQDLASKLGITDRAISHWENGRSIPDASLYKGLCKELGISIEELINGEKDDSEESKVKAIISTVNDRNRIKRKNKRVLTVLIIIFVLILIALLYYYKNVKVNLIRDSDYLYDIAIDYIRNKEFKENPDSNNEDFNVFYSYHGFGIEQKNDYKYVYMWIYNHSYYIEDNGALAISSSNSVPCKITFKNDQLQNIEYPKEGKDYYFSVKEMFPNVISTQVLDFASDKNINKLFSEVSQKMQTYYGYLNLDMDSLSIDDLNFGNLIMTINYNNKSCSIPVQLNIYKNIKYALFTAYKACRPGKICTLALEYTNPIEGTYDYDVVEIIKHSVDANNLQFTNDGLPEYDIYSGSGHHFITDINNKHLKAFLDSINVDLKQCAKPKYSD